ncbi:hypothetical protein [Bradyrhizobium ottawaense]|uniref:hypothetical protein n=1 Tax=Bradyrhizobium ottawaense TaxID=931866 RepID=UPI003837FEB4
MPLTMISTASMTAITRSTTTGRIQLGAKPVAVSAPGATSRISVAESATGTGRVERIVILPNPLTQNSLTERAVLSVKIAVKTRRRKS